MKLAALGETALVGRESELARLKELLDGAAMGKGAATVIIGEPGIGKTRLLAEFKTLAEKKDFTVLSGAALPDAAKPFLVFSQALEPHTAQPLFQEQEFTAMAAVLAINRAGLLVAQASSGADSLDTDIFAGMLSAVQDFVRDSFSQSGERMAGLGRLEYGDMKILLEHGQHLFLTAVLKGAEHPDMKNILRQSIQKIEKEHGYVLSNWNGSMEDVLPIQKEAERLAGLRFSVLRELEGLKLENERIRLADQVLEIMLAMSRERPLVLVLEDLHWADEPSLFILSYLARNISGEKIMLVCSARPNEGTPGNATGKMLAEGNLQVMKLEKLKTESVYGLVSQMYENNDFPDSLMHNLTLRCAGNPFFTIELLRQMEGDGNITSQNGKYVLVNEDYNIPDSVEMMVQKRLETLESETMALAEYASCIGREFERKIVQSHPSVADAQASLAKLEEKGMVKFRNGSAEFTHALFQEVIYNSTGDRWKQIYHKKIGEYYEVAYEGRTDDVIYDLARHFSKCRENEKAADYCKRAGEKAESQFATEQAVEFYKSALKSLVMTRKAESNASREAELLERLGDLKAFLGEYEDALGFYGGISELAVGGEIKARVFRKMGGVNEKLGRYDVTLDLIRKGKETLADSKIQEWGRLHLLEGTIHKIRGDYEKSKSIFQETLGFFEKNRGDERDLGNVYRAIGNLHRRTGNFDMALENCKKSLAHFEKIGNDEEISMALSNIGNALCDKGYYKDALAAFERGLSLLKKGGNKKVMAQVYNNIGVVYKDIGEVDKAVEQYQMALKIIEKIGMKQALATILNNIGNVHAGKGEFGKALEYFSRGLKLRRELGDRDGIAQSLGNLGLAHSDQGEFDEALAYYSESLKIAEEIGDSSGIALANLNMGEAYRYRGELERALAHYTKSRDLFLEIGDRPTVVNCDCGMANTYLAMGEKDKALGHAKKALADSLQLDSKAQELLARQALAPIYREIGEMEKARSELGKVKSIAEEQGQADAIARAHYELGLLLADEGNAIEAGKNLETALAKFEKAGMKYHAEKCRKALAKMDSKK